MGTPPFRRRRTREDRRIGPGIGKGNGHFCWKCFFGEAFLLEDLYVCLLLLRNQRNPRTMCSHQLRGTGSPKTDCSSWVGRTCLRRKQIKGKANVKPLVFTGFWGSRAFQDSVWRPKKAPKRLSWTTWGHLEPSWAILERSWSHLGNKSF